MGGGRLAAKARKLALGLLVAAIGVLSLGVVAEAHALLRSSTPADGQTLDRAPGEVSITFTEWPDPRLSIIHVLNSGGQRVERGMHAVPGDRYTLTASLPSLPNGVYTVTWTTVSAVDGHYAAGSFAFGVGTSPAAAAAGASASGGSAPAPTPLAVAARWVYYVGLALLLGGTWITLFAFRTASRRLLAMAGVGAVLALLGLLLGSEAQREAAGVGWTDFFSTSLGDNLIKQVVPVAGAGVTLAVAGLVRHAWKYGALLAAGALTLVAILGHVMTTHANASHVALLMFPAQWAHLTAFAVWIGGLAALLAGVRGVPAEVAARAVRRFSQVAGLALAAVAITGVLRAIDEVGAWSRLVSTLFGGLVLVKVGLFVILAGLGAFNRYRNVAGLPARLGSLRRVGSVEVGIAAVVIAVAAVLTALAPPSYAPVAAAPALHEVVATGQDFGTTVKVRLVATPGYPGSNRFTVELRDFDTGKPIDANRVALRFDFPGRPNVGESTVTLKPGSAGTYGATATNLSLAGRWSVTVAVERGLQSVEVPLTITTAAPPEQISVVREPGLPNIYTVALPTGRSVQLYVDPGKVGINAVHATFFQGQGELAMGDGAVISGTPQSGPTLDLTSMRFDPVGHFIGQGPLSAGRWRFDVTASAADGTLYQVSFEETIQ